jgi:hypothetical protein
VTSEWAWSPHAEGGTELEQENVIPLEVVLPGVVAGKAANADTKSAADRQVQHLIHFFVHVSHFLFFYFCLFLHCFFNQVLGSIVGNNAGGSAADQQDQHLSHFLLMSVISFLFFSISVIFYIAFPSGSWKHY